MKYKILGSWITKEIKVRVVTRELDFDNTLLGILGVIKKHDKLGVLLLDNNNKKHFIPYTNIADIQYLGTGEWKEYLPLNTEDICNLWGSNDH